MQLTTTQRQVLVGLLSANRPITIADLAHALGLSPNTVKRQLPAVKLWLKEYGRRLERRKGTGIWVSVDEHTRHALLDRLASQDSQPAALGPAERRDLLIFTIHTSQRPLITQHFQNLLNVSRSTVLKDLAAIAEWYEARNLFLVRRPNYGTKLMGAEADWRKVFIELVLAHFGESMLFRFCTKPNVPTSPLMLFNPPLARVMVEYLSSLPLAKARELVGTAEMHLGTRFIDSDHLILTLHIALLVRRVSEQCLIEIDAAQLRTLSDQAAYRVAYEIALQIQSSFGVMVPQGEVGHLTIQLLAAKPDSRVLREVPTEAGILAHAVLSRAGQILRRSLDRDTELLNRLAAHLAPTLRRLMLNLPIRNPLLDDIRTRYAEVYEAAEVASGAIGEYIGKEIPPDEVAFIAMYLAGAIMRNDEAPPPNLLIVCPSGAATSWLLHSRLKSEIPNIPILDILSTRDLRRGVPKGVDLIISTVPLHDVDIPTVVVSALLSSEEVAAIKQAIEELMPRSQARPKEELHAFTDSRLRA